MTQYLISCIVPVYNGERYLGDALDSIIAQTYQSLEIIVVDDGSTDDTASVASSYGDRIRYFFQPNAGPTAARNLGLGVAQGEFVAFLDADDLWHEEKLRRQMACFEKRSELALCITMVQNFWSQQLHQEEKRFRGHRLSKPIPGYSAVTLLARRILFETVGVFNERLQHSADTDWFLRAAAKGAPIELLPDVLVYRRLHENNRSREMSDSSKNEYLELVKNHLHRKRHSGEG
ncbi:MAG: glycosyltransferase [Deltaproteobacteria bacterium]|nr:glycosyltransferase [Deltaproteobacteria bacterium]